MNASALKAGLNKVRKSCGGEERFQTLIATWEKAKPFGNDSDRLYGHGMNRETAFIYAAIRAGFQREHAEAYLKLVA